jgi:hypothetical protein
LLCGSHLHMSSMWETCMLMVEVRGVIFQRKRDFGVIADGMMLSLRSIHAGVIEGHANPEHQNQSGDISNRRRRRARVTLMHERLGRKYTAKVSAV